VRDRRWDFLYDRQKQPVKAYVLERFAEELAGELLGWPPPFVDWVSETERARWAAGAEAKPRDDVLRLALELARLDLLREHDAYEQLLERASPTRVQSAAEAAAVHLLTFFVTERCLALKEHAEKLHLTRSDLAAAVVAVEKKLFRVTLT
jgi:sulfur relay (sulfurtransferase) DsrF/TusC family protein